METKPLLYGLIGFFLGGLLVSIAATTFDKQATSDKTETHPTMSNMSMNDMTEDLKGKTGDDYDRAFVSNMIAHHEGAVEMARLSAKNAKHIEVKELSENIISAQVKEISEMKKWQADWGYTKAQSEIQNMDGM